jgi:hypothetical protein
MSDLPSPNNLGYLGAADPTSGADQFNAQSFLVKQILSRAWTITLAQVKSVTNAGEVKEVGTVSIQPLVNQVDGQGNATPHGTIFNVPYLRLAGGSNAMICDPAVNDIGIMLAASRDISSVKANKGQANPGSSRQFDPADAIYIGGVLGGEPKQWVRFTSTGLEIADKNNNKLVSGETGWTFTGNVIMDNLQLSGPITAHGGGAYAQTFHTSGALQADGGVTSQGVSLNTHHHLAPNGNTGPALP